MSGPRVLLMTLSERTSAKGNAYMTGWLGKASVVAFKSDEPDKYGNPQWLVYAQEPQQRDQAARQQAPTRNADRGQRTWDRSRGPERHAQREAGRDRTPEPPADWLDDSAEAIRDLTEGPDR